MTMVLINAEELSIPLRTLAPRCIFSTNIFGVLAVHAMPRPRLRCLVLVAVAARCACEWSMATTLLEPSHPYTTSLVVADCTPVIPGRRLRLSQGLPSEEEALVASVRCLVLNAPRGAPLPPKWTPFAWGTKPINPPPPASPGIVLLSFELLHAHGGGDEVLQYAPPCSRASRGGDPLQPVQMDAQPPCARQGAARATNSSTPRCVADCFGRGECLKGGRCRCAPGWESASSCATRSRLPGAARHEETPSHAGLERVESAQSRRRAMERIVLEVRWDGRGWWLLPWRLFMVGGVLALAVAYVSNRKQGKEGLIAVPFYEELRRLCEFVSRLRPYTDGSTQYRLIEEGW